MGVGGMSAYQIRGFCPSRNSRFSDPGTNWHLEHTNFLFGVVRTDPRVQTQTCQPSLSKQSCWDLLWVQSLEGGNCLGKHLWGSACLALLLLAQGSLVHRHYGGGGAANSMEKVLSNRVLWTQILRCADPYIYLWQFSREKCKLTPSVPLSLDLLIGITSNSQLYFKVWT